MKVIPISFDSMGVRSMCTFIETDIKIIIDPSAALGPNRYRLPPHELELKALAYYKKKIHELAINAEALIISHYHYDHYDPNEDFYENKMLFIKHPKKYINASQKRRASLFLERIGEYNIADSHEFSVGKTRLKFSPPVKHGDKHTKLGWVVMTCVEYKGKRFIHTSDTQGPGTKEASLWIIQENPDIIFIGGPPTYMTGWRVSSEAMKNSLHNCINVINQTDVKLVVLDHHILRDKNYTRYFEVIEKETGLKPITAAEFLGKQPLTLEANRRDLFVGKVPENYENFIYTK